MSFSWMADKIIDQLLNDRTMKFALQIAKVMTFSIGILVSISARSQEFSAGINTETPNTNAVLHLVAPNGDQGLLIPTLTTTQRNGMALSAADNGMLVFDTGDGLFYYYFNGWIALTTAASETDPTVQANVKDGVDWTELTSIPGVFADNTDDVNDLDADPTNELISSAALAGNVLTITEAGTPFNVDLSTLTSASQDLQFAGNILSITGDPTPTLVDFSAWDQNAADDITTANVGTAANQIVQLNGSGQLPAVDGSLLTNILNAVAADGTTISGDGVGTPLAANVGTGPNQIVQLDGSGFLPALDGSALTGVTSTVTVDGTTITGDGSGAPLQISSVPLTNLAAGVATPSQNIEFNGTNWGPGTDDIGIADGTTIIGDGAGTPYAVNVGTGPNQIVQLDGTGVLPVIDGSNLTGVTNTVTTDGTTITGDGSGTPLAVGAVQLTNIGVGGALAGQVIEFDGTNWIPATDDGLTAVATDITLVGDGAGIPLSVNRVNPAIIAAGGATLGQILEFDGTNWVPVANSGLTTVATDGTTIAGDGTGTPLSVSSVPLTTVAAGGATSGQVLEFNGTNWAPALDDSGITTVNVDGTTIAGNGVGTPLSLSAVPLTTISAGGATLGQSLEFNGTSWIPATDDVGMLATTYDPTAVAGDAFNFGTHVSTTAAVLGNVLTFNGTTWDAAAPAGITLPYSQTLLEAADLFALTNTGIGGAGNFTVNNLANAGNALSTSTNGTGNALNVLHSGTGVGTGIDVSLSQATATGPGIRVNHAGLGAGIEISATTGPPLFISGGSAGDVLTTDGLGNITLQPGGITLPYSQVATGSGADLFAIINDGIGGVGYFEISNSGNIAPALSVLTNGTGASINAQQTGTAGSVLDLSITGVANTDPGISISHAGAGSGIDLLLGAANTNPGINILTSGTAQALNANTSGAGPAGVFEISNAGNAAPAIEVINTGLGPDIKLPTGAVAGYVLTSSDAVGNAAWQPGGITLPYSPAAQADAGPLFTIENSGTGPAAAFLNTGGGTALGISGNISYGDGAARAIRVIPSTTGNGDNLQVFAGDGIAGGPASGGDLILGSGAGTGTGGNGGNIQLSPGTGSGGGTNGGIVFNGTVTGNTFFNGIPRFGNPAPGLGGRIALEDDGGANAIEISAHPNSSVYTITLPQNQGTGSLTNDGTGNLVWSPGGFTAPLFQDATNIVFGSATSGFTVPAPNFQLGAIAPAAGGQAQLSASSFGFQSQVPLLRANGAQGGELALQAADVIGEIAFIGYDGGGYFRQGMVRSVATENWVSASNRGAAITFHSTPTGSTIDNEVMRIQDGNVGIGISTPVAKLDINQTAASPGVVINTTGVGGNGLNISSAAGGGNGINVATSSGVAAILVNNTGTGPDLELNGAAPIRIPGGTVGHVLTLSNAAGDVTLQPAAAGFTLDGNNNLSSITGAVPPGTENFLAGANTGNALIAGGNQNILIGNSAGQSITSGSTNIVLGVNAGGAGLTTGAGNVVIGENAIVNENTTPHVVIGQGASAAGAVGVALGSAASAAGDNSTAVGRAAVSNGANGIAFGINANVGGGAGGSIAIGSGANVIGNNSIGIGSGATAPQDNSAIIGDPTITDFYLGVGTTTPSAKIHGVNAGPVGGAGVFQITDVTNPSDVVSATTTGAGRAGEFTINNATSTANALVASTTGTGSSLSLGHSGATGTGILIDMNGTGDQAILISGTTPGGASIQADGDITTAANLNGNNMTLLGNAEIQRNFITPTFAYDVGASGPLLPNTNRVLKLNNPGIDIVEISGVGARDGQEILLIVEIAGAPFNVNSGVGAVNLRLDNDSAFTMDVGSTLHLIWIETLSQWVEISRSR